MPNSNQQPGVSKVFIVAFDRAEIVFCTETGTISSMVKTTTQKNEVPSAEDRP